MIKNLNQLLNTLPPEPTHNALEEIRKVIQQLGKTIVVLDDDPTGTQTVYDLPVLTTWDVEAISTEFQQKTPLFYILTNSRSFPTAEAEELAHEIGNNLVEASIQTGQAFTVISRSDSTLRGHFPEEVDALTEILGISQATKVLIPAFVEGGRYTINDVHYVQDGDEVIPAAETPFAQDTAFGFKNSDLRLWTEEKTQGAVKASSVISLSIDDIRTKDIGDITQKLKDCPEKSVCVINAASRSDLEIAGLALLKVMAKGKALIFRTAASIVPVLGGLSPKTLLTADELSIKKGKAGLIIIGSYVPKTSSQLEHLKKQDHLKFLEINVEDLLSDKRDEAIRQISQTVDKHLRNGETPVIYTSRKLITGDDKTSSLIIGNQVSSGLVNIMKNITEEPAYVLAKGGITSSDIATKGLGIKKAIVWGQILTGVPVWKPGKESKFPGIPYIVFPGNVGGPEALSEITKKLA